MAVSLNAETEKLIETRLRDTGAADADELIQMAIHLLPKPGHRRFEDLDVETRASITAGFAEAASGQTRALEDVRDELLARFVKR